jgi:cobalt/nickel transport system permease protein
MHIPDGFIDGKTAIAAAALSAAGVGLALRQVRLELPSRRMPLLGLAAAFLFAAQMINFPVIGGTSGHLIGGVLAAALLGPASAIVVMATVLIVQCFLFADGGLSALGANIFNMALLSVIAGYAAYRLVWRMFPGFGGRIAAVAFAGWFATVLASIGCAGELALSRTVAWGAAFPAMAGIHMLIGLGEGLISALVFAAIVRARPELAPTEPAGLAGTGWRAMTGYGLLVALGLAVFVAPFASPLPDGLEAVAAKLGFEHQAAPPAVPAPAEDYLFPGVRSAAAATALAGGIGTVVVFGLALLLGRMLGWRQPEPGQSPGH